MVGQLFSTFLTAVQSGDHQAAADFVRRWEPYIRQVIRRQLDARTRQAYDSGDICQSVWLEFLRAGLDEASSEEIRGKLAQWARGKAIDRYRREQRRAGDLPPGYDVIDPHPTPCQQTLRRALVDSVLSLLNDREWLIFKLHSRGFTLKEIAAAIGGTKCAVARMFQRARKRLRRRLGKEDQSDAR